MAQWFGQCRRGYRQGDGRLPFAYMWRERFADGIVEAFRVNGMAPQVP